jgi:sporulation protein YlmC with PRC-barrel domain
MKVGKTSASIAAFCVAAVLATSAALAMAANRAERSPSDTGTQSGYQSSQPGQRTGMGGSATQQLRSVMSGQAGQGQLLSSSLLKSKVQDQQGKDIGHISELIVDPSSGRITHAVVSHGQGFMGIGNKEVLLPWNQLRASQSGTGNQYQFTADESQLRVAQEFNRSQFEQGTAQAGRQQQQTFKGSVVSVGDTDLRVRTDEGVMTVSTGKDWSNKKGQLNLKEGDQVSIKGYQSGFGAQRQIVAQEITANNQTITLDTSDRPYRETGQEQDQQQQPRQDQPRSPDSTQPYTPSQPGNSGGSGTGTGTGGSGGGSTGGGSSM